MKLPSDEYKSLKEWKTIEKALKELVKNKDLSITTQQDCRLTPPPG
jgi:hypothetical protein